MTQRSDPDAAITARARETAGRLLCGLQVLEHLRPGFESTITAALCAVR